MTLNELLSILFNATVRIIDTDTHDIIFLGSVGGIDDDIYSNEYEICSMFGGKSIDENLTIYVKEVK